MTDEIVKRREPSSVEVHIDDNRRLGSSIVEALRQNPEAAGRRIFDIATIRAEKWFNEEVMRQVEDLIKHRSALLNQIEKTAAEVQLTEKRIAAIESGQFKVEWNGRIKFNDVMLNFG